MQARTNQHEQGSAYLATLLLLVVLTLMGLSLALVTSTESRIGANERILERVFYATDAGIGIAAARILVGSDYFYDVNNDANNSYILNDTPGSAPNPLVRSQVSVGPLILTQSGPCNLCEINNAGSYQNKALCRCNILLPARGQRQTLGNALAQRRLAATIDIQPWNTPASSLFALQWMSPADLAEKTAL
ncbi:MAG: PilX N-terminal domain-containing pilus assembly protein [Acidobacteria bacterium]|nr:PilX N-terminal domain-containing pilus assembly protein [Acidobacteriota bacterium]